MADKIEQNSRREFLKKAGYTAPAILTISAVPAFAKNGSVRPKGNEGVGNGEDPPPPGHDENQNDGPGTGPGNPGSQGGANSQGNSQGKKSK